MWLKQLNEVSFSKIHLMMLCGRTEKQPLHLVDVTHIPSAGILVPSGREVILISVD